MQRGKRRRVTVRGGGEGSGRELMRGRGTEEKELSGEEQRVQEEEKKQEELRMQEEDVIGHRATVNVPGHTTLERLLHFLNSLNENHFPQVDQEQMEQNVVVGTVSKSTSTGARVV